MAEAALPIGRRMYQVWDSASRNGPAVTDPHLSYAAGMAELSVRVCHNKLHVILTLLYILYREASLVMIMEAAGFLWTRPSVLLR